MLDFTKKRTVYRMKWIRKNTEYLQICNTKEKINKRERP